MELAEMVPQFNLYDVNAPVYTHMRYLPPSKINACDLNRALLSEGASPVPRVLRSIILACAPRWAPAACWSIPC